VSQAASQASIFFEQVARERRVFSFLDEGHLLVLPMPDGEVSPFWSSLTRLTRVQRIHSKYRVLDRTEVPLERFLSELLPFFESEQIRIGANWSGPRLSGFDYSACDVGRNLDYWIRKLGAGYEGPSPVPSPRR